MVASHVSLCDECRARMHAFDAVGGALLEEGSVALKADAFAKTLRLIETRPPEPPALAPVKSAVLPAPLRQFVGGDVDVVKWRRIGGGVCDALLARDGRTSVRLLKIPAGAAMPDHGHSGTELTLVLQGAFRDDDDRFGPGDIEIATEELHHTPIAEEGVDCICLAATEAPLRFHGLLPKIAQRVFRI